MIKYDSIFKKLLLEQPANVSPPEMTDTDHWQNANPEIMDNEDLASQIDVEGIDVDMGEEYIEKIKDWNQKIGQVSDFLDNIHQFAAQRANDPGASEIYSGIGNIVESLLTDLGTLSGHFRTLGNKVRLSMQREQEKQNQG